MPTVYIQGPAHLGEFDLGKLRMEKAVRQNLMIADAENIIFAQSLLSKIEINGKPVVINTWQFNPELVVVYAHYKNDKEAENTGEQLVEKIGEKLKRYFNIVEVDLANPTISRGNRKR